MNSVVIFDGDNTLWDTNIVFTGAQKLILKRLAESGYPADPERDFGLLRRIDSALIQACGTHEYDASLLPFHLLQHFKGTPLDRPIARLGDDRRDDPDSQHARKLGAEFEEEKGKYPPLFPDVVPVLQKIREQHSDSLLLYSEGDRTRIRGIYNYHRMSDYFCELIVGDKSLEHWQYVRERALSLKSRARHNSDESHQLFVVGDRLDRDIRPGNLIGAVTVYKPGGYKGQEIPRDLEHTPRFTIHSLHELLQLL